MNPDFAQIEADPTQITLGRYELWLTERRPFFVDGADLFQLLGGSGEAIFYSRRIGKPLASGGAVPILAGLKAITKFERFELGGLSTVCQETTLAGYDTAMVPHDTDLTSYYSAVRVQRDFLKNSNLGFLYADKENRLMNNRALGMDGALLLGDFSWSGDVAFARYQKDSILNQGPAGGDAPELAGQMTGPRWYPTATKRAVSTSAALSLCRPRPKGSLRRGHYVPEPGHPADSYSPIWRLGQPRQ